MFKELKELRLTDLVDISFLQEFQDGFSEVTGIASLIKDENGAITKPSAFVELCHDYIRSSVVGEERCSECDLRWAKLAAEKDEPLIYKCHAGLNDFVVPIIIEGHHIASIYGGQILTEEPNEENCREIARQIGADEDGFWNAYKKVKIIPKEQLEIELKFLTMVANNISQIGYKNLKLMEKSRKDKFYRDIVDTIRDTFGLNEIKETIVSSVGNTFRADRCFIMEYSSELNKFLPVVDEYLSSAKISGCFGADVNKDIPNFLENLENKKNIIIKNGEILKEENLEKFQNESKVIERLCIKSAYAVPLFHSGEFLGALVLHYVESSDGLGGDENLQLLELIANQVAIAIYQAKLYETERKIAQREKILRDTIEILREKTNPDEIKKTFVDIIANYFQADRCLFACYDAETGKFTEFQFENLRKKEFKSLLNFSIEDNFPEFVHRLKCDKNIIIKDLERFVKKKNLLKGNKSLSMLLISDVKSDYGFLIKHKDIIFGAFVMHFIDKKRVLSIDELDFFRSISKQAEIAIYQVELLEKERKTAQREILLRNIAEKIRSSLNVEDTLSFICEETAKLFNVQRVTITSFSNVVGNTYDKCIVQKEYKTNPEALGIEMISDFDKVTKYYIENSFKNDGLIVVNSLEDVDVPDFIKKIYSDMGVKSVMGASIKKGDSIWGHLVLSEYKMNRYWSEDEKNLLKSISDQVFIAINQAELFEKEKINAKREKLIKDVFIKVMSTFAISEIKHIVTDIGQMTKADRCYFVEAEPDSFKCKPVDENSEYLSSPEIKSVIGYKFKFEDVENFIKKFISAKDVVVFDYENIQKSLSPEFTQFSEYAKQFDLKSGIAIPFFYMDKLVAVLAIEYVNNNVIPTEDELDFLRILGNQVGIAFNQVLNYQKTKETAEREFLLRRIIETVRSSLDIDEVKQKIVTELCTIFKADRCFFRSFDKINNKILPPDVEYLSSEDIPSLKNVEVDQQSLEFFVNEVKKEKREFYPTVADEDSTAGTPVELYMQRAGLKADYAVPIVDRYDELTWLVLHFVKYNPKLGEDYKKLLETIAYQVDIAFEQIKLYKAAQRTAQKESLNRTIMEAIRSSLDIGETKEKIVNIWGKTLSADRCFIMDYDKTTGEFVKTDYEYLSSEDIPKFDPQLAEVPNLKAAFLQRKPVLIRDKQIYIDNELQYFEPERYAIETYHINSAYALPLYYSNEFYGVLSVHYLGERHVIEDNEVQLLNNIVEQISVAIHQANLFNLTQVQAEREKISRNIIEILRSSMDKDTIKKQFVRNIGKYFHADRVLFSEYDQERGIYLPVDEGSEYLSGSDVKSFVGYDWTCDEAREYIQPLLERREINIFSWDEYIRVNSKNQGFVSLFEDANVKSSYNFPIIYQQKIMGFFCIEFTQKVNKLAEEDIIRIRSICTQAGIALFQAELYQKTQNADKEKGELIENISKRLKAPLNNIIEISSRLPRLTQNCDKQIDDLNNIYENGKKLLDLSSYIEKISGKDVY